MADNDLKDDIKDKTREKIDGHKKNESNTISKLKKRWSEKKRRAEESIERLEDKKEKIKEEMIWSQRNMTEVSYAICHNGELGCREEGETTSVTVGGCSECKRVVGFMHTHPRENIESVFEPSPNDIFSLYYYEGMEAIVRKSNISMNPEEEEEIRYEVLFMFPVLNRTGKQIMRAILDNDINKAKTIVKQAHDLIGGYRDNYETIGHFVWV